MISKSNIILSVLIVGQAGVIAARGLSVDSAAEANSRGLLNTALEVDKVVEISIDSGSGSNEVSLRKDNDGIWRIDQQSNYPADGDKVARTLRDLAGLEIADVVSETEYHHRDLKVSNDDYERRVTLKAGDSKTTLLLGVSGRAGSVHMRRADKPTVYAVRDYAAWRVSDAADTWVDKNYFTVDASKVVAIGLKNASGTVQIVKHADGSWKSGDGANNLDAEKVAAWLSKVTKVRMNKPHKKGSTLDDPIIELALGVGTSAAAADGPVPVEISRTLRISKTSDGYRMLADGADFVVDAEQTAIKPLLEAKTSDFMIP